MENNMTLKQLAVAVLKKEVPANFSLSLVDMEGALRDQFRKLAPDFNSYRRNQLDIFELIQEVVDDVLPNRIRELIGSFAEVKTYAQGDKARFQLKKGRNNVKRFITRVGLGGVYERVRLDSAFIDVTTHAVGGAAYCEFEQFLDGQIDFSELTDLILAGVEDQVYVEVQAALIGAFAGLPTANKHSAAAFDAVEMRRLILTARAYGANVNIICTPEFAATITPSAGFIGTADEADKREKGYVGRFEGANVIVLPQSFEDETNTVKVFNPQYAFVIATGGQADERIVKVALEGQTIVKTVENADSSMEFSAYKKLGVNVLTSNHISMYKNTALA